MDAEIIGAIIGATATILAAIIAAAVSWRKKHGKKEAPAHEVKGGRDVILAGRDIQLDSSKRLTADKISGGTMIQAERIEGIQIVQAVPQEKPDKGEFPLRFVTEAIKASSKEFRVLFSIWNNSSDHVKLYEFLTKEYVRVPSVMYYGGQRSVLRLIQNETTLWKGKTYEIPPRESASFELKYAIKTGPADGEPWIIFGIFARYHSPQLFEQLLHSDALYLFSHYDVKAVTLETVEELNGPNMWRHEVYALMLQSFSEHLQSDRHKLIQLMKNDYLRGFKVIEEALAAKASESERRKVAVFKQRLLSLLEDEEILAPLTKESQKVKDDLLEELQRIAVQYCGMAFTHVCQPLAR